MIKKKAFWGIFFNARMWCGHLQSLNLQFLKMNNVACS